MRVFKTRGFARFARSERISDASLSEAVRRAEPGLVDADLGGGVIKQRVARPGQGRSGGYRVLIAYRAKARAVFLFGFAKSAQANIEDDELATLREIGSRRMTRRSRGRWRKEQYRRSTMKKKKTSTLTQALLETADDMRKAGILDARTHEKITMRHLGSKALPKVSKVTAEQIRAMRTRANMSQAVFARHLNLTVGYVSQLERGAKQPTGAALALLNIIKRKGIEAIS